MPLFSPAKKVSWVNSAVDDDEEDEDEDRAVLVKVYCNPPSPFLERVSESKSGERRLFLLGRRKKGRE